MSPATAAAARKNAPITMCSEAGCKEPAQFTYVWAWGEQGACCSLHRTHVQQKCDQLDRGNMNFTPIDPNYRPPVSRDERTQLIAAKMSAEQETAEVRARAGELYQENAKLVDEVRRLRARNQEGDAQLADRKADLERVTAERDRALADYQEASAEVARLKPLVGRPAPVT